MHESPWNCSALPRYMGIHNEMPLCGTQATPRVDVSADKAQALTERIQDAGTEVVKAKACSSRHAASALLCSWLSRCKSLSGARCTCTLVCLSPSKR